VPKLFGLSEKRFKIISKSRHGVSFRFWLFDLYNGAKVDTEELLDKVDRMNEFVFTK